jgi:hypothetical protein
MWLHFDGPLEGLRASSSDITNAADDRNPLEAGKQRMLANGWCVHRIAHLSGILDLATFLCLSKLQRSACRQESHLRCVNSPNCVAYDVDFTTYQTRHSIAGCKCAMVETPYADLIRCIHSGAVPLLSIECAPGPSDDYVLRVHQRRTLTKYVAISHVWADGLGNPSSCALPLCQVRQLKEYLRPFGRGQKVCRC